MVKSICGEGAEFLDGLQAVADVLNFRNGEGRVGVADAGCALAHVKQAVFVAIGERAQQHGADHAEDGGVGADAESQGEGDGDPQSGNARQGTHGNFQIAEE